MLLLVFQTQSFIILPRNEPCVLLLLKITHDDVLEDDKHYVVQVLHHGLLLSRPAAARARIADSRPEPGPLTVTSTVLRPCSCADLAAALKPFVQQMV